MNETSLDTSERNAVRVEALDDGALLIVRKDIAMIFNLKDRKVLLFLFSYLSLSLFLFLLLTNE